MYCVQPPLFFGDGSSASGADINVSQTMWLHEQAQFGFTSGTRLACGFRFAQTSKRSTLTKKHSCDEGRAKPDAAWGGGPKPPFTGSDAANDARTCIASCG